jgi:hypothetical protein
MSPRIIGLANVFRKMDVIMNVHDEEKDAVTVSMKSFGEWYAGESGDSLGHSSETSKASLVRVHGQRGESEERPFRREYRIDLCSQLINPVHHHISLILRPVSNKECRNPLFFVDIRQSFVPHR